MKRITGIITALMLIVVAQAFATDTTTAGPERKLEFKRYDSSYFERNDTGLTTQTSYLVFTSRAQFDKIFGAAPTMGQNHFLPDNTFDTKIVVAAIARGHFLRKYDDPKVTTTNGMIYVSYKIKDAEQKSATFASPLILAVDKGEYSEVVFTENGKRVGAATFPKPN
jgi:hypothetical protein